MSELRQNAKERAALNAAWQAQPSVRELGKQVEAFARQNNLKFDAEGLTQVLKFANGWIAEHGALPNSGILVG
jgi:hypothetical protein